MSLLSPRSVAVIGASTQPGKVGHDILRNLLREGFKGKVYPVNPKAEEILNVRCFPSVKDIPDEVDLAVVVIPAEFVPGVLTECGEKGIQNVIIISAGFREVHTKEGEVLEREVAAIAKKHDLKIIGPNCLGILRPDLHLNASFAKDLPLAGHVTLISQSGATAVGIMDLAQNLGLGFASVFSIGNKTVMNESDFLELCEENEATHVIGLYLESIEEGVRLLEVAHRVSQKKPIVLLKSGVSEKGKKAAASHTGALAGSDQAIDALCKEAGIHRAGNVEEFLDLLSVLSTQPPLLTDRIAVVTNAGGPGILATDEAEKHELILAPLSEKIAETLKKALPETAAIGNPIDLIGDAKNDRFEAGLIAARDDAQIDGVVVILTPQIMTPSEEIADTIVREMKRSPLMPTVTCFMGGSLVERARMTLRKNGIPVFDTPEQAIRAIAALRPKTRSDNVLPCAEDDLSPKAAKILSGKTGLLDEVSLSDLFSLFALPLPKQSLAKTKEEASAIAERIGFPVIAKISAKEIVHKTDIGGVAANLQTKEDVERAFETIIVNVKKHRPDVKEMSVLIQQMLPAGNEFIVGAVRDNSFGPLILVGLGGIYTELFKDTSVRIGPVSQKEAYGMLEELQVWKLLLGMRGKKQSDIDALAKTVETVSRLMCSCPEIDSIDLNPVLVDESGVRVADAKVVLKSPL